MFLNEAGERREVGILDEKEKKDISNFLQGAVYAWCNDSTHRQNPFCMRDLMGGNNRGKWEDTVLGIIKQKHTDRGESSKDAYNRACIEAGFLLKNVLWDEKKLKFNIEGVKEGITYYRLVE